MNLHLHTMIESERRRDELAEIRKEQLLRSNGIRNHPWTHRQLAALGNRLVTLGIWLQRRYANLALPVSSELLSSER